MSDNTEIFKHVLQKRIGNTEYWREIVIFEEGPFVFRVVQELQVNLIDSAGTLKAVRPAIPAVWNGSAPAKKQRPSKHYGVCNKAKMTIGWFRPGIVCGLGQSLP